MTGQGTDVATLKSENGNQATSINSLNTTATTHGTDIATLKVENGAQNTIINSLTATVANHTSSLNALPGTYGARITALENSPTNPNLVTGNLAQKITGLVTVGRGSDQVVGSGTKFLSELRVGDAIKIGSEVFSVIVIDSDTGLRLSKAHAVGVLNADAYTDQALFTVRGGDQRNALVVNRTGETTMFRRIARASGIGGDDTDNGAIVSRIMKVNKSRDGTGLRIAYTDNFRVIGLATGSGARACTWEIRVDQKSCGLVYSVHSVASGASTDMHSPQTVLGYCEGLKAGNHDIGVYVGPVGGHEGANCYTGWNTTWTLEAEEVY